MNPQQAPCAARQALEKMGGKVHQTLWTLGSYDLTLVCEAPSDETITALGLQIGALGNVRSTTLRAFDEQEMEQILRKI